MVSTVAPEAEPLLWVVATGQSTTPPWTLYVSRIEIRLLRDTRRVLEYLSNAISQVCAMKVRNESTDDTYNFPSKKVLHRRFVSKNPKCHQKRA